LKTENDIKAQQLLRDMVLAADNDALVTAVPKGLHKHSNFYNRAAKIIKEEIKLQEKHT